MNRRSRLTPEEIKRRRELYGEVVSFRLRRSNPDHAQILNELQDIPKDEKQDLFVRAMLSYLGQPIHDDNAATARELREMVNELLKVLGEANQLISKLSRTTIRMDDNDSVAAKRINQLSSDFIDQMNAQQRSSKTLRKPSSEEEE